jgi:hypothetical protein
MVNILYTGVLGKKKKKKRIIIKIIKTKKYALTGSK